MNDNRVLIGFAAAPLPILAPLLAIHASILSAAPPDSAAILRSMLELVLWSYGATFLIGIPIHLFLRWKGRDGLFEYIGLTIVAAMFSGCALAVVEMLVPPPPPESNPFGLTMWSRFGVTVTMALSVAGSVSAWVFWKIAVRKTPF